MPTWVHRLEFVVVVLFALLVGILSTRRSGNRILACALGCMFTFFGVIGIMSGKIAQRHGSGPPLEGSLATVGSTLMIGFGIYMVWLTLFRKSDRKNNHDQA